MLLTVRLSLSSCMMMVLSLKESSLSELASAVAFSSTYKKPHPVYTAAQNKWKKGGAILGWVYLFGEVTSFLRRTKNLVVEDREVQGEAQVDGVCRWHFFLAQIKCLLVGLLRVCYSSCKAKTLKSVNNFWLNEQHQNNGRYNTLKAHSRNI